jgi:predicted transposase YbfD/YdcC
MRSSEDLFSSMMRCFSIIPDPRVPGRCQHRLIDVIVISVLAVLCGAESFYDIQEFGKARESWLRGFLELGNGIPSHDTFARVLCLLSAQALERAFSDWTESIRKPGGQVADQICIDGKSIQSTVARFGELPVHLLNVYSREEGLVLAQLGCRSAGLGETPATLSALDLLEIKGTLISTDAGNTTLAVAEKVRSKGGDYLLPIKKNQLVTLRILEKIFADEPGRLENTAISSENAHGREEIRRCTVLEGTTVRDRLKDQQKHWPDLRTLIRIERKRTVPDKRYTVLKREADGSCRYVRNDQSSHRSTEETIYYLCSRRLEASEALRRARNHWSVENQLHWVLDVNFGEDYSAVRNKVLARNLAVIRKMAFNLVSRCPSSGSKKGKMKRAAWSQDYLQSLIFQ